MICLCLGFSNALHHPLYLFQSGQHDQASEPSESRATDKAGPGDTTHITSLLRRYGSIPSGTQLEASLKRATGIVSAAHRHRSCLRCAFNEASPRPFFSSSPKGTAISRVNQSLVEPFRRQSQDQDQKERSRAARERESSRIPFHKLQTMMNAISISRSWLPHQWVRIPRSETREDVRACTYVSKTQTLTCLRGALTGPSHDRRPSPSGFVFWVFMAHKPTSHLIASWPVLRVGGGEDEAPLADKGREKEEREGAEEEDEAEDGGMKGSPRQPLFDP